MARKLFCELCPLAYRISRCKCMVQRSLRNLAHAPFAAPQPQTALPCRVYEAASLIRRTLDGADPVLQENKAQNLALAAPLVDGVVLHPGQEFSFWRLVGSPTARRGYRTGLVITKGQVGSDIGGGMCQFTNLLHWLVLHTPLTVTEHHHHDGYDLFPDHGRTVPFGTGTSILYHYLDYRFRNDTPYDWQLRVWTDGAYLHGAVYAAQLPETKYHVAAENECFVREADGVYRCGQVVRTGIDRATGNTVSRECIKQNHARILYDEAFVADRMAGV